MAVLSGTVANIHAVEGLNFDPAYKVVEVLFTIAGTYAAGDGGKLTLVPTLIQNSRRNGKTVTMRSVMAGRPARSAVDNSDIQLATVAISTNDVTFLITTDWATEIADGALPSTLRQYSFLVAFTEA